ncbi:hypothetical protein K491DRAFT_679610 [Lophiostoma macrostomum CBS 122681]|uniref:Uncharacterized protein n=1 Tax=Lophiostoma macrostomum CBS 122681 TaxID=1314788 RepID=A0A6A6T3V0_9PLEO|nr:hypothetical protein K491DRAFT_679610 [Lophiostoma macrostomum CBS 122681]
MAKQKILTYKLKRHRRGKAAPCSQEISSRLSQPAKSSRPSRPSQPSKTSHPAQPPKTSRLSRPPPSSSIQVQVPRLQEMAFPPIWSFGVSAAPEPDEFDSHPMVQNIRSSVTLYRKQSATHFALRIAIFAVEGQQYAMCAPSKSLRMKIGFTDNCTDLTYECRPVFKNGKVTKFVQVYHKKYWVNLEHILPKIFPVESAFPDTESLRGWWACNGKCFNWEGLPNELRLHILQSCVQGSEGHSDYRHALMRYYQDHRRKPGPYEVVDILGDWMYLLAASTNTRQLALKLCLEGNDRYCGGLTVLALNLPEFTDTFNRLSRHYQMVQKNGVPKRNDSKSFISARRYLDFPKQYPHLDRFATLRHGIRKIYFRLNFLDALHFWKVTDGGFKNHVNSGRRYITCDVFEKLPCLNGVKVFMPEEKWKDVAGQDGPRLWDKLDPCPRKLHRIIAKRMAEALAPYKDVQPRRFMDKREKQNFEELHDFKYQSQRFTQRDFDELYADCGGGIQLTQADLFKGCSKMSSCETLVNPVPEGRVRPRNLNSSFWPPICVCAVPCNTVWWRDFPYD